MSEIKQNQMSLKRRLARVVIALVIGYAINSFARWLAAGLTGAGHGIYGPVALIWGPFGISIYLFPLVCALAASNWVPGAITALSWECVHHAFTMKDLLALPADYDRVSEFASVDFSLCIGLYVVAHLAVLIILVLGWLDHRKAKLLN